MDNELNITSSTNSSRDDHSGTYHDRIGFSFTGVDGVKHTGYGTLNHNGIDNFNSYTEGVLTDENGVQFNYKFTSAGNASQFTLMDDSHNHAQYTFESQMHDMQIALNGGGNYNSSDTVSFVGLPFFFGDPDQVDNGAMQLKNAQINQDHTQGIFYASRNGNDYKMVYEYNPKTHGYTTSVYYADADHESSTEPLSARSHSVEELGDNLGVPFHNPGDLITRVSGSLFENTGYNNTNDNITCVNPTDFEFHFI